MTILLYLADEPDYYANNMYARFLEYANVADRTRATYKSMQQS